MSSSVLVHRRHALRGPAEDEEATVAALIAVQAEASYALEEGAIEEATYEAFLARADAIDVRLLEETATGELRSTIRRDAEALLAEVSSTRVSGAATHRSNVWIATIGAFLASILMVAGLAAWANRRKR